MKNTGYLNYKFINVRCNNYDKDWDANDPKRYIHEVVTMGCRTRVYDDKFGIRTSIGRGNLSFSTINIVKLALQCRNIEDKEERIKAFFNKLEEMMEITGQQLEERYEFQSYAKKNGVVINPLTLFFSNTFKIIVVTLIIITLLPKITL
jgi:ribonucleoside-triphosphate reductase